MKSWKLLDSWSYGVLLRWMDVALQQDIRNRRFIQAGGKRTLIPTFSFLFLFLKTF